MLNVTALCTEYADEKGTAIRAAENVTFHVPAGRLFTLLGPSGCGKTTVLRCIAEQERKRLQVIRTPTVRRFEAGDQGMVRFGAVEMIEGRHFALVHRQDDMLVLAIDASTYERLKAFTRGRTVHLNASGAITLGRGHRR